jgi:hypothetical protein
LIDDNLKFPEYVEINIRVLRRTFGLGRVGGGVIWEWKEIPLVKDIAYVP